MLGALSTKQAFDKMICRKLILVLGDQLDRESPALLQGNPQQDLILMIESRDESRRVASHKARTVLFLSAMRHHAEWLRGQGWRVHYCDMQQPDADSFDTGLRHAIDMAKPRLLSLVKAGEYGVQQMIENTAGRCGLPIEVWQDDHFLCSDGDFAKWRQGRKSLVMEHFYRFQRKRLDIMMENANPLGGQWNFDRHNRKAFGRQGPGMLPLPPAFPPDTITRDVMRGVNEHFPGNPGRLDTFAWPVTREQALDALADFIDHRLPAFGPFQDAMWDSEPWLSHSLLSAALNLKLLRPREVIDAATEALALRQAPIASAEGFVRQILGWREYIRGIYWSEMPDYLGRNTLGAELPLPDFYWTGDTDMACLRISINQTMKHGYAHHIQRLMVTGLFALMLGVRPQEVHAWYLAVYVDAVEWVEAPNTIGMSQHADGAVVGSKPYVASGRYIQKMSNYCTGCRYRPDTSTGIDACPFTTLYWDFLIRHESRFINHPRAAMQWRMLNRLDAPQRQQVLESADELRSRLIR